MKTTRTQKEIIDRFNTKRPDDVFGFEVGEYIDFMDYENAKEFLKEGTTEKQWSKVKKDCTKGVLEKIMLEYMEFAFEKANGERGLSASRSISHYDAWLWLYGDEQLINKFKDIEYEHYGKEKLIVICDHFGWDYKNWDNGIRTNG